MAEAPWRQAAAPSSGAVGHAPSARLKSDIPGRAVEPPLCVQNAMLTKDKKPFTYTPGGIDLSEIRSPRMARRLELNAMNEGVGPVPQTQHPNYPTGPLPPSALAAMQPQLQVQVLPAGGIPQSHHHGGGGGPPPPPPPPSGVPPPPPKAPPMMSISPVPLDSFERPDMTKIIPENPMAMLRKTSGPVIKRDPIFNKNSYGGAPNNVVDSPPPRQPQPVRQPDSPQYQSNTSGLGSIYVPPVNQNTTPSTPAQRQPQSPPFANQRESSPNTARSPPAYYKRQPSLTQQEPSNISQRQPPAAATPPLRDPQTPDSPKATLSKAPTPWLQKRPQQQPEAPEWAVNDRGRDSPVVQEQQATPWRQQQQQPQQQQPEPQTQSQPWQQRQQKQPEPQAWQQRQQQPEAQPWQQRQQPQQPEPQPWQQQQQQPRQPQSPPWQQQQAQSPPVQIPQGGGVRKQVNIRERPQESGPVDRTEVVIVNEPPQVFHHPGTTQRIIIRQTQPQQNNYQQQQQRADGQGTRIIPVQRDGASSNGHANSPQQQGYGQKYSSPGATPTTPGGNRVLQKITNTDGDDDEDQPVTAHSPKMPQHFPQRQVSMKQNEGDQELMNKFKQVPQGQQNNNNRGPKVRTIPIQLEGDGPTKTYVPPSEQTVPEPKKYMGSSIPGRSFKMLQAMTAPDDCANPAQACENNEHYPNDPSSYMQWGYDPNYPPPSPYYFDPYWGYYSQNYPGPNNEYPNAAQNNNSRMTPIPPSWGYYTPNYGQNNSSSESFDSNTEPTKKRSNTSSRTTPVPWSNDNEPAKKQNGNARCTPVPFWPYYYPNYSYENPPGQENQETQEADANGNTGTSEEQQNYQQYPPYWDPYYYGYYYGAPPMYPPVYSPYPFYPPPQADSEEVSGYSSNDEMAFYGARFAAMTPNTQARPKSTAPATPSLQKQLLLEITEAAKKLEEKRKNREDKQKEQEKIKIQSEPFEDDSSVADTSDSDGEMVGYEVCRPPIGGGLKTIRSVSDIKIYDAEESLHCSDEEEEEEEAEEEESENTTEENDDLSSVYVDENVPHQLSVIFEESERTDSAARYVRESSVATTISEDTATIENSDDEEAGESDGTVLVKLPLTFKISAAERQKVTLVVGNSEIKPQVAEKSSYKQETSRNDKVEQFLKAERSIIRQLSSDSYQTAESDGETFYNTQNSNAVVESNNIKDQVKAKHIEREQDVDWWGHISKHDDLPKATKKYEEQSMSKNEDIQETESNSLKQENISTVLKEETLLDVVKEDEDSKYLRRNSSSSEEDFWGNTKKEQCYETTPVVKFYNVDTTKNNANKDVETNSMEIKNDCIEVEANSNEAGVVNDLNVQEGMEKMEAVLTSIISTINSRTSSSGSEDDKTEEVDFWAQIIDSPEKPENDDVSVTKIPSQEVPLEQEDTGTGSACSRNSSLSKSNVSKGEENVTNGTFNCLESKNLQHEIEDKLSIETRVKTEEDINQETEQDFTGNGHIVHKNEMNTDELESDLKPLSVQERIKVLQESAACKQNQQSEETEIKINVKERISALEDGSLLHVERAIHKRKSISRKSSLKSYEEYSEEEEEGDSGVTSDISRHISETDTDPDFSDLKKLNKYQRASTHSRLFKLLQDECDSEEVPEDSKEETQCERMQSRRELLNLPLHKNGSDPESFSSSGFTSPGSPTVNDRLVNELIQSLLRRKQGRVFKHMTMEKVQAAALRILQEDMDGLETLSSSEDGGSFLSPKKPGTGSSTPAQTPQEYHGNFNEYSQYYDSWAEAERLYEGQYDVLPSKAFRLIQEHAAMNKTGAIGGLLARCPRVLSNKNVQKELMKLLESHESPSPSPEPPRQPPDANEASNAS